MQPVKEQLDDLVTRIVETAHPLRIILFGSASRAEMGPDSDIDVLVVMPEGTRRRETARHLQTRMLGYPFAVDFLVATPNDLEQHRHDVGRIYYQIFADGREIYAA